MRPGRRVQDNLRAPVYLVAGQPAKAVALLDKAAKKRARAAELVGRAYEQAGRASEADAASSAVFAA